MPDPTRRRGGGVGGPGWGKDIIVIHCRLRGQYEEGFGVNRTCYETHEILVLGGFRGLSNTFDVTRYHLPKGGEAGLEGFGWAGRFRGQLDLPRRVSGSIRGGFRGQHDLP